MAKWRLMIYSIVLIENVVIREILVRFFFNAIGVPASSLVAIFVHAHTLKIVIERHGFITSLRYICVHEAFY